MLRPEGSDPATIATRCASGSTTRHRGGATPRRSRSARTASAGGCTRRPARSSPSVGYADATAEAIAREAGMSKATFYEHFDNKEDCIIALHDDGHDGRAGGDAADRRRLRRAATRPGRVRAVIHTFLEVLAAFPDEAQTLLVEIIGAGPRAMERRDRVLAEYASYVDDGQPRGRRARRGAVRLASPHDAFAIVGAVVELASRQIRTGEPDDIRDLEPVVERLVLGLLHAADGGAGVSAAGSPRSRPRSTTCRRCPRLVAWREQVAREKRAAFRDETYWGRPIGGFGDPAARVLLLGLAPAAHGANRTGPHVHRRPLGRLPVRRAAPHGLREPAGLGAPRRRPARCATAGSPPPCAARRPPTSRCPPSATRARTGCAPSWPLLARRARRRLPRRASRGRPAFRQLAPGAAAAAALRPRRRGAARAR